MSNVKHENPVIQWSALTHEARAQIELILGHEGSYKELVPPSTQASSSPSDIEQVTRGLAERFGGTYFCSHREEGGELAPRIEHIGVGVELLTGYRAEELMSGEVRWDGVLTLASLEELRKEWEKQVATGFTPRCWSGDMELVMRTGEVRPFHCIALSEVEGGGVTWRGVFMDVAARPRAEIKCRAAFDANPYALCMLDPLGNVLLWNEAIDALTQRFDWKGVHHGEPLTGCLDDDLEWAFSEGLRRAMRGEIFDRLIRLEHADGGERWLEVQCSPVRDDRGHIFAILGVLVDLTPRILEGRQIDAMTRRMELGGEILTQLPMAVVLTNDRWQVREWMARSAEDLGLSGGADVDDDLRAYFLPEHLEHWVRWERGDVEHMDNEVELSCVGRGGTVIPVSVRVQSVTLPDGEDEGTPGWLVMIQGIGARRELEEELRQAQKLEALGMLTGGMTHDLNNLLTVILGHLELAETELGVEHNARFDLNGIRAAVERAGALTVKLLAFARAQMTELQVLDVVDVITQVRPLLLRTLSEDIRLLLRLDPRTHFVRVDAVQMEQLLINLVVNARDAISSGRGEIVITTERRKIRSPRVAVGKDQKIPPGEFMVLSVIDNGDGINPDDFARIFEPFFTTKAEGHGTGLGLPTCLRIVKQNGGYLRYESKPGVGTIFEVWLAIADSGGVIELSMISSQDIINARQGTQVLLVEDDRALRETLRRSLEFYGYRVFEARHGKAALRVLAHLDEPPDLVVTDVAMPDMGGVALSVKLKEMGLNIPVLFMSGYSEEVCAAQNISGAQNFVSKPFTPKRLLLHVQDCIRAASS